MTRTILNVSTAALTDLDLKVLDFVNFVLVDTVVTDNKRESVYQYVGGDAEHPLTLRTGHYRTPSALEGKGQTNISIKLSTYVYDDVSLAYDPCSVVIASTMPGLSGVPDLGGYISLMQNALSALIPTHTLGVADTAVASKLSFGVTNIIDETP